MSKEVEGTISWPAPKGSIQARIKENVLATTEDGTVKEMSEGKGGFVRPDTFKNASGTQCYVWFEHHWNGMGDYRWDHYYVPSWAVITVPVKEKKKKDPAFSHLCTCSAPDIQTCPEHPLGKVHE